MNVATCHSIERLRERQNMKNNRVAIKTIKLALQRGKRATDYSSWENEYLASKESYECKAVAYRGYCFIINETGQCVTTYPLPDWFGEKKRFAGKEKIRNPKKYWRMNGGNSELLYA